MVRAPENVVRMVGRDREPCMTSLRSAFKSAAAIAAVLLITPLSAADAPPLEIAKQGYLFAGGKYSPVAGKDVMSGQIYAEYQIPRNKTHPYPIVMVHGAIQTGTNFT